MATRQLDDKDKLYDELVSGGRAEKQDLLNIIYDANVYVDVRARAAKLLVTKRWASKSDLKKIFKDHLWNCQKSSWPEGALTCKTLVSKLMEGLRPAEWMKILWLKTSNENDATPDNQARIFIVRSTLSYEGVTAEECVNLVRWGERRYALATKKMMPEILAKLKSLKANTCTMASFLCGTKDSFALTDKIWNEASAYILVHEPSLSDLKAVMDAFPGWNSDGKKDPLYLKAFDLIFKKRATVEDKLFLLGKGYELAHQRKAEMVTCATEIYDAEGLSHDELWRAFMLAPNQDLTFKSAQKMAALMPLSELTKERRVESLFSGLRGIKKAKSLKLSLATKILNQQDSKTPRIDVLRDIVEDLDLDCEQLDNAAQELFAMAKETRRYHHATRLVKVPSVRQEVIEWFFASVSPNSDLGRSALKALKGLIPPKDIRSLKDKKRTREEIVADLDAVL